MRKLLLLIKANLLGILSTKKKNKKAEALKISSFIFLFLFFLFLATIYEYFTIKRLVSLNYLELFMPIVLASELLFTLMLMLFSVKDMLFNSKDYELLQSLPISNRKIILSKLFTVYLYEYIISTIIIYPALVLYAIYSQNYWSILLGFLMSFCVPVIPLAISALFGFTFGLLFEKSRFKNIILTIIYLGFMNFTFAFSFMMSSGLSFYFDYANFFMKYFLPIKWFNLGLNFDFWALAWYFLLNTFTIILLVLVVSIRYKKICNYVLYSSTHKEYKKKKLKKVSHKRALYHKEFIHFFKTPSFLMNSLVGSVVNILVGISSFFIFKGANNQLAKLVDGFYYTIPAAVLLISSISNLGSNIFSIDGGYLWLYESMPISPREIINAKLYFVFTIILPFSFIGALLMCIAIKMDLGSIILITASSVLLVASVILVHMLINLCFPKLDWENETALLKQSKATICSMLVTIGFTILVGGISLLIERFTPLYMNIVIMLLASIIFIVFYLIFEFNVVRVYKKNMKS